MNGLYVVTTVPCPSCGGERPSFSHAARPEAAEPLYQAFCDAFEAEQIEVARGVFGARMVVQIENEGPVTIVLET